MIDGFDADLFDQKYGEADLKQTFIALAYQFDDGGRTAELGSSLTDYLHTIDFLVLGHTATWGRNVAHVIKAILRTERGALPLRDWNVATDPRPIIDYLPVAEVSTEREFTYDPRPWSKFAWTTRLRVEDSVYASA